jgi:hypothetical protein
MESERDSSSCLAADDRKLNEVIYDNQNKKLNHINHNLTKKTLQKIVVDKKS